MVYNRIWRKGVGDTVMIRLLVGIFFLTVAASSAWATNDKPPVRTLIGHVGTVSAVAFSSDGGRILSGDSDGSVKLWDAATGQLLHTFFGHRGIIFDVAFSPDGSRLLSGSADKTLKVWDAASRQILHTFNGHQKPILSVAFSPDGSSVLSGSSDDTVKLWDVVSGQLIRTFTGHDSGILSIAFSPDGEYLLSGSLNGVLKLWDRATGRARHSITGHYSSVLSVTFSSDGDHLLSGSSDNAIKLWNTKTGRLRRTFTGHQNAVQTVTFSPDGGHLLSGSDTGVIKLWDVVTGRVLQTFISQEKPVASISIFPDGGHILVGSRGGNLKFSKTGFITDPGYLAKAAEQRAKAAEERSRRLADAAKRARAAKKLVAESAARQAEREAQQLKKLAAEAKIAEAEARRKMADAAKAEAEAKARLEAARKIADKTEFQRLGKLKAERRVKEAEANEAHRNLLMSLTVGLRPENTFMDIAVKSAKARNLPQRGAQEVRQFDRNDQVHVVSVLPSGWVEIAEEGEPIGWMHRAALKPSSNPSLGIAMTPSSTRSRPSTLYATSFSFPKGKTNLDAVAVIVGNRVYQHRDIPEVSYAYNDVEAIRQYVIKTRGFRERNVFVLKDATKAQLESYFGSVSFSSGRLFNAVREDKSDVFVYFSGHGVPGKDSTGYLFPTDGDPTQPELTGYSIQTLVDNLAKVPARSMIIALDTCFSGVSQAGALVKAASPVYLKAKIPSAGPNSIILTAAAGSQIASWDTGAQLGLFTRHLLEGMLGKADTRGGNNDGKVQLGELQGYVQSEVTYQARRRYSRDQTPEILGNPQFVLSTVTAAFPGFGDPDAVGSILPSHPYPESRQPDAEKVEPDKENEGFTLFGIKIVPGDGVSLPHEKK
jgi:hypothetical protein